MADEVDPIEALLSAHTKRLQEIADQSFQTAKSICDDTVSVLRRQAGRKSDALDNALAALGITAQESPRE